MNSLTIVAFVAVLAVANAGIIGHGLLGLHGGIIAPGHLGLGLVGSGIEGQYIPSGLERLYDDGSYRGEHHLAGGLALGHGLGLGLGLGLAGSGLEGQYIPSGNELHHDDGSYRGEHHLAGLWH